MAKDGGLSCPARGCSPRYVSFSPPLSRGDTGTTFRGDAFSLYPPLRLCAARAKLKRAKRGVGDGERPPHRRGQGRSFRVSCSGACDGPKCTQLLAAQAGSHSLGRLRHRYDHPLPPSPSLGGLHAPGLAPPLHRSRDRPRELGLLLRAAHACGGEGMEARHCLARHLRCTFQGGVGVGRQAGAGAPPALSFDFRERLRTPAPIRSTRCAL